MTTRLMLVVLGIIGVLSLITENASIIQRTAAQTLAPMDASGEQQCHMTTPESHEVTKFPHEGTFLSDGKFGNDSLSTILGSRIIFRPGGAGWVMADGSLSMKYMWWRLREGHLTISGKRLDGPAPPLRAHIPAGYGDTGFQATGVIFPTPGCWEVTGHVGDGSLTFVVWVEMIGDGPCSKEIRAPNETGGTVATITRTEERVTESMYGARKFRVSGERQYEGGKTGIRGKSAFHFDLTRQPGMPTTFVGDEQITATIGDKKGSFAIRHEGTIKNGIERSTWKILDASGTGDLADITGKGSYSSGLDDHACYTFIQSGA